MQHSLKVLALKLLALKALSALCVALLLGTLPAQAGTYYALEMEKARLSSKGMSEDGRAYVVTQQGGGMPARIVKDPSAGSKVLVLETRATPQGAPKDRAEMRIYSALKFDRKIFFGMRVKYRGEVEPNAWHVFMQCHQPKTGRSPPLSLNLLPNGRAALIARTTEDTYERLWSGPMPAGRWHDVAIGFRMGDKGHVQLWLNGRKMADARLPLRWKGYEERCVLKTGVYRGASSKPFQMRMDDIRLGDRYVDVSR